MYITKLEQSTFLFISVVLYQPGKTLIKFFSFNLNSTNFQGNETRILHWHCWKFETSARIFSRLGHEALFWPWQEWPNFWGYLSAGLFKPEPGPLPCFQAARCQSYFVFVTVTIAMMSFSGEPNIYCKAVGLPLECQYFWDLLIWAPG